MGEDEFWMSTPAYFAGRQNGHQRGVQERWEQTRFVAFVVAKTVDSKKKIRKPSDLLPLPWDNLTGKRFRKMTPEERKEQEEFDKEADLIMAQNHPEIWADILKQREAAQHGSEGHQHTAGSNLRPKKPRAGRKPTAAKRRET